MNFYGFFIALGILVGVWVIEKLQKKLPSSASHQLSIINILPWVLIPGIIGARAYHVLDYWSYYGDNWREIFYLWQGGLGIFGAFLGGLIGFWLFLKFYPKDNRPLGEKRHIKDFSPFLDLGVIGLSIGQAIGRWGNFFNQELYGWPTDLAWGIYIRPENRLPGFEKFTRFHPLFLYESLGCFLIFIILLKFFTWLKTKRYTLAAKRKKAGSVFFLYLFLYSFLRFWLEFLRIESWTLRLPFSVNNIKVNQLLTLLLMFVSSFALIKKFVTIKKVKNDQ